MTFSASISLRMRAVLALAAFVAFASTGAPAADLPKPVDLVAYESAWLPVPETADSAIALRLPLGNTDHIAVLEPKSLRSDRFQLMVSEHGKLNCATPPPARTFRGTLDDIPDSIVAVTAGPQGWTGVVMIPDPARAGEFSSYAVQPLATLIASGTKLAPDPEGRIAHVTYRSEDTLGDSAAHCGVSDAGAALPPIGGIAGGGGIAGSGNVVADIAFDTDVEYYFHNGGSVANTLADIETILNGVDAIYRAQLAITYEISYVIVRTDVDPYDISNANALLETLRTQWNATFFNVQRDLVHLLMKRTLDNTVIGIAKIGEVCDTFNAYGLSVTTYSPVAFRRFALTAHELGHNWNARHCNESPIIEPDCRIMCASICSCGSCTTFEPRGVTDITAFKNSLSPTCIPEIAFPLNPPFFDAFVGSDLDRTKWTYVNNATVFAGAVNPPSPPNVLLLNASGPDNFLDDDIRSNFIQLGSAGDLVLSYFTEHRFVDAGEQLAVEYFASNFTWVELNRITSDGIDQDQFQLWVHALPANAKHNEFRLRFRPEVDENIDQWYVDDVRIAAPGALMIDSTPQQITIGVSPNDATGAGAGPTPLSRAYPTGVPVTLTAPLRADTAVFVRWTIDGVDQPLRQNVVAAPIGNNTTALAQYARLGDMDGNGRFDNFDIDPFVLALVNRPAFMQFFPNVHADIVGDFDDSGDLTNFDIEPFVDALINLP